MRAFFKDKKEKDKEKKASVAMLCPQLLAKIKSEYWNDVVAELKVHADALSDFASWADEKSNLTLIHVAAERGALPVLEMLISPPGVNLNPPDKGGWAPLHSAASNKQVKACMMLIERGANPNVLNDDKTPPLHYVVRMSPFAEAVPLLELLVKKGVDLESKNKYGESALQQAVSRMNKEAVQYLLSHKADPNSTNQFGETALHKLARSAAKDPRALELMQMIVAGGGNYHLRGRNGSVLELVEEAERGRVEAALKSVAPQSLEQSNANATQQTTADPVGAFDLADSTSKLSLLMAQLKRKRSSRGLVENDTDAITTASDAPPSPNDRDKDKPEASTPKGSRVGASGSSRLSVPGADQSPGSKNSSPRSDSTSSSPATASSSSHRSRRDSVSAQLVPSTQSMNLHSNHSSPRPPEDPAARRHHRSTSLPDNAGAVVRKSDTAKLVLSVEGYRVENGKSGVVQSEYPIAHIADNYLDFFVDKHRGPNLFYKHMNYIGTFKAGPTCIVSVLAQPDPSLGYRTIVRTKDGAMQIFLPAAKVNSSKLEKDLKHLLEEELCSGGIAGATLYHVEEPELQKDLLEYEQNDPQKVRCLPVGVVYAKGEQTLAREMWDNETHSERFEQFLRVLGDKIQLQGWGGYAGGLDVAFNKKGTHSIYTEHKGYSIMYHVSTMLPFVEADPLKLGRSRMIGNDVVNLIYHEGEVPYHPRTLTGAVTYVFIVVRPRIDESGNIMYRVACCSKDTVPAFGPDLPDQLLTAAEARDLLLAKILNGHMAAQNGPGLSKMYTRPREALLEELAIQYVPEIRKQKEKEREKEREREKELSAKVRREKEKEKSEKSGSHK